MSAGEFEISSITGERGDADATTILRRRRRRRRSTRYKNRETNVESGTTRLQEKLGTMQQRIFVCENN